MLSNVTDLPPAPTQFFANLQREHSFEPVTVKGSLPATLRGTLYRNGPGIFEQFGRRYDHFIEGDGAISAVRFERGLAQAAARIIDTVGLRDERAAGRHRNSFMAAWPERLYRFHRGYFKNTANTHVVPWQNRLYALNEGGKPTQIDPDSLATVGVSDLDGVVTTAFSAHPHRVASRRTLYNFGLRYGRHTRLVLYALPDQGSARKLAELPLAHPVMLHDFIATDQHLVFFVSPLHIVLWRMMLALGPFTDNFRWTPDAGTEVIVVPIDNPDRPIRFHTDPFCQFHFAGAFEERDEIVVDYVRYRDSNTASAVGDGSTFSWTDIRSTVHGILHRARIDLRHQQLRSEPLWDGDCEYPQIAASEAGGRHSAIWVQSSCYIDGLLRFRISRIDAAGRARHYTCEPGEICSEPVLTHGENDCEQNGTVLSLVYNSYSAQSHVAVLDAHTLQLQARVQLPQAIPMTFHGSWWPTHK